MRRKNKPHSYRRLSTFEQAALVFQAVETGPHRVRARRDLTQSCPTFLPF